MSVSKKEGISLFYRNVSSVHLSFYLMDAEMMFSKCPFPSGVSDQDEGNSSSSSKVSPVFVRASMEVVREGEGDMY